MQNILLHMAYDGTHFEGYQAQQGRRTVAGVLGEALDTMTGRKTRLIAAGRTDSGVHATGQCANFLTHLNMPAGAFAKRLNALLPDDLAIISSEAVSPQFHARFADHWTTYRYLVENGVLYPQYRHLCFHYDFALDWAAMQQAAALFLGEHDVSAFAMYTQTDTTRRMLRDVTLEREGSRMAFTFTGNGFLRRQVRMMVGALLSVGRGEVSERQVARALARGSDHPLFFAAPPQGLTLVRVDYVEPVGVERGDPKEVNR